MGDWIRELLTLFWDYLKCWILVNSYEEAVVLRKGNYIRTLGSGLYWKWPFIDYCLHVVVTPDTKEYGPISISTLDGKTIAISLVIEYAIVDTKLFILENNDSVSNMKDMCLSEMSDLVEDINWVDIKKKTTKNALKRIISERVKALGVEIKDLKFTNKCESKAYRLFSEGDKLL